MGTPIHVHYEQPVRILRAPTLFTIINLGTEWRVADLATRATEPVGRFFDLSS